MKHYADFSLIYAIVGMICGVFYREFTKFSGFTGNTTLSVMHSHYFVLGMIFFLVLLLLEKNFNFTNKNTGKVIAAYNIGLNITGVTFLVRGFVQVKEIMLSSAMNASLSGIAGIGHILLGISIILLLLSIKKSILNCKTV